MASKNKSNRFSLSKLIMALKHLSPMSYAFNSPKCNTSNYYKENRRLKLLSQHLQHGIKNHNFVPLNKSSTNYLTHTNESVSNSVILGAVKYSVTY